MSDKIGKDGQINRGHFRQEQPQTSWQMKQQQKMKQHPLSPQELGGQPGQQNAGSGQGKDSLNNFDIDTSGEKHK